MAIAGALGACSATASAQLPVLSTLLRPAVTSVGTPAGWVATYRGEPVTHYLDPSSGVNVIADPVGSFVSGWKLNSDQLQNVLGHGGL